jgi:hypothetical protein
VLGLRRAARVVHLLDLVVKHGSANKWFWTLDIRHGCLGRYLRSTPIGVSLGGLHGTLRKCIVVLVFYEMCAEG